MVTISAVPDTVKLRAIASDSFISEYDELKLNEKYGEETVMKAGETSDDEVVKVVEAYIKSKRDKHGVYKKNQYVIRRKEGNRVYENDMTLLPQIWSWIRTLSSSLTDTGRGEHVRFLVCMTCKDLVPNTLQKELTSYVEREVKTFMKVEQKQGNVCTALEFEGCALISSRKCLDDGIDGLHSLIQPVFTNVVERDRLIPRSYQLFLIYCPQKYINNVRNRPQREKTACYHLAHSI